MERPLTQAEAAEQIGVARLTWNRWENGKQRPRPDELRRVIELLSPTSEDLAVLTSD